MDNVKFSPMVDSQVDGRDSVMLYGGMYGSGYLIDNHGNYIKDHEGNFIRVGGVLIDRPPQCYIGGRSYRTVTIGGKVWMAENLDFKEDGIAIGDDGSPSSPAAWYYNNDESTYGVAGNKYGLLYNGHAAKYLNDNRNSLFPGWHVPTVDEWNELADAIGGAATAGTKLKSMSGWDSGNGTDDYGFGGYPAGGRGNGSFFGLGDVALFWTATATSSSVSYRIRFTTGAEMNSEPMYMSDYASSLRLVMD